MRSKSDVGGWILPGVAKTFACYLRRCATTARSIFFPRYMLLLVDLPVAFTLCRTLPAAAAVVLYLSSVLLLPIGCQVRSYFIAFFRISEKATMVKREMRDDLKMRKNGE